MAEIKTEAVPADGALDPVKNLKYDFPAALVVFLVALPLCLGVALASGAPLFSGIVAGVTGGVVVALLSGSALSVSGPAAGLTVIVLSSVQLLGGFQYFLVSVVIAGILQLVFGYLKAGSVASFFPSCVIKGMLAAIGLILILKQIPHAVGYDADYEGDYSFVQPDGENTFSELLNTFSKINVGAFLISAVSLLILILWERPKLKKITFFRLLPAPLWAVVLGILMNALYGTYFPQFEIKGAHLVTLPVAEGLESFFAQFTLPDFSKIFHYQTWVVALTIAVVASIETLLSIEAVDKIDPYKRISPTNRELKAQGVGNLISGLLGGLPLTAVIVRSSANVNAGGRTKASAFAHGLLLFLSALLIPSVLNMIPLACLAAILLMTGYKLTKPSLYKSVFKDGWNQFLPFMFTIAAILLTDLLKGIAIGMLVGIFFVIKANFRSAISITKHGNHFLIRLKKDVSFLNKPLMMKYLEKIPEGAYVIIDGTGSFFIDHDITELIKDFVEAAPLKGITVELKQAPGAYNAMFKKEEPLFPLNS